MPKSPLPQHYSSSASTPRLKNNRGSRHPLRPQTSEPRLKNNKSLGQHWLKNRAILDQIADLAVVPGVDTCLEIGPGLGTLTSSLLRRFAKVIAVEFDARLATNLPNSFPGKNLEVINADILDFDLSRFSSPQPPSPTPQASVPYVVAGNIPYYITSPIIKKFLLSSPKPAKIVLLIQREVAERLVAEPSDHSLLSLFAQNLAEVELGPIVPASEFTPPPKVDSAVIVFTPLPDPIIDPACLELAKIGFSSPRKKLVANLAASGTLSKSDWATLLAAEGINPDARAEDLSLWDWENLYNKTLQ